VKTRKLLVIILTIALLAVYYILGTDYLKQNREHEALAAEITEANLALAEIPPPLADLESQLADARTELDAAKQVFPDRLNSTLIINSILRLADEIGVKAIPLVTQPWATESVNEEAYFVFRLHVAVAGTFTQLSSFLSRLENGENETLFLEYVTVDSVNESFRGDGDYASTIPVDASLEIAVYSRPPVADIAEEEIS